MTPELQYPVEPDWKAKLRAAALLALKKKEDARKRIEAAEALADWVRYEAEIKNSSIGK